MSLLPCQYTVSQLNRTVELVLKKNIGAAGIISVTGEISTYKVYPVRMGGQMLFFTLHEGEECLTCRCNPRDLQRILCVDTQTGEVFNAPRRIEDVFVSNRKVLVQGTLSVYARRDSTYQLNVASIIDMGASDRARQLKELKDRLAREGLFSDERKRPLPPNPVRVALVTSPQGAVIHDFLRNAQDRGLGARIRLYPVRVQGDTAGREIAQAVDAAGHDGVSQVVVVIRGGGSEEDLACFNDETLARTIAACPVPVLAGIGHETDFSLADMAADVRASTPTKAAQLLWSPRSEFLDLLDTLRHRLHHAAVRLIQISEQQLSQQENVLKAFSPQARLKTQERECADLARRCDAAMRRIAYASREQLVALRQRAAQAGIMITSSAVHMFDQAQIDLARAGRTCTVTREEQLERLALRLKAVSPLAPLERGFAILRDEQGHVLSSTRALAPGALVRAQVMDGAFTARVTDVRPGEPDKADA